MAYEELKQRQSVMWGNGPYQRITETLIDIHDAVVERLAPGAGDRWLDLACGTGAVAERAAAAGARTTGVDLAPGLIETAKDRAAELGLEIEYVVGDAERLSSQTRASTRSPRPAGSCSPRPRGYRARARAGHGARRADRARQLDTDRRPREDVQGDGALPAGAAAE